MNGGILANLFVADIEAKPFNLQVVDRAVFPSLTELRQKLQSASVYASDRQIFGYGENIQSLKTFGFIPTEIAIGDVPGLTCHLLGEGFAAALAGIGFEVDTPSIRTRAFDRANPISVSVSDVSLLPGCEFKTTYLRNPLDDELVFGLVIDMKFQLKLNGNPSNYHELLNNLGQKYDYARASQVVRELRIKTGDLTPYGRNVEAARFRLQKILSIVSRANDFTLPTGNRVELSQVPTRVVLEA